MTVTRVIQGLLAAAALAVAFAAPYVFSSYLVGIIAAGLIFGLFAMSINLMAGWLGLVSLGQAGIMATAGYAVAYVAVRDGSYLEQLAAGVGAGLLVSAVFGLMSMRTGGVYFLMITLAQGMVVWGMAYRMSSVTGGENGLVGIYRPESLAPYWVYYYVVVSVVLVCFLLLWLITRSPLGLTFQGLRDSESRMVALGYSPALYKFYAFMLSGAFATVAGIIYVYHHEFISPTTAEFMRSGHGVLMTILGGVGTLTGPVIGALIIVFIENVVSVHIGRWPTVMGVIFILVVLFARSGLVGGVSSAWRRTPWGATDGGATSEPGDRATPEQSMGPSRTRVSQESSKEGIGS